MRQSCCAHKFSKLDRRRRTQQRGQGESSWMPIPRFLAATPCKSDRESDRRLVCVPAKFSPLRIKSTAKAHHNIRNCRASLRPSQRESVCAQFCGCAVTIEENPKRKLEENLECFLKAANVKSANRKWHARGGCRPVSH